MKIRELFTKETKSSYTFDEIEEDENILDFDFDKLKLLYDDFGGKKYKIYEYREDFFVVLETEGIKTLFAHLSVYEYHGDKMLIEEGLFLIYGHESIILFFDNGNFHNIRTR